MDNACHIIDIQEHFSSLCSPKTSQLLSSVGDKPHSCETSYKQLGAVPANRAQSRALSPKSTWSEHQLSRGD